MTWINKKYIERIDKIERQLSTMDMDRDNVNFEYKSINSRLELLFGKLEKIEKNSETITTERNYKQRQEFLEEKLGKEYKLFKKKVNDSDQGEGRLELSRFASELSFLVGYLEKELEKRL